MAIIVDFLCFFSALIIALTVLNVPVYAQVGSTCTASMLASFTPCMNYVTNSTSTGTSPTSGCCNSLRAMMSNGTDCMCQIATGGSAFQLPINRTLALSLPKACQMPGVPLQCKASNAPIPAPGPIAISPTASVVPNTVSPSSSPALAPEADATPTTDSSTGPVFTPSAAMPAHSFSPSLLLSLLAAVVLKYY